MSEQEIKLPSRLQVSPLLARRFTQEYETMLKAYLPNEQLELTELLLGLMEHLSNYGSNQDEEYFKAYQQQEDAMLQKYGSRFRAYIDQQFYKYFHLDIVLAEKGVYTNEQYNDLEEQSVTPAEVQGFVTLCRNVLYQQRTSLLLQDAGKEPSNNNSPAIALKGDFANDEQDKEITKAKQLLAVYYFLKASLGIEARDNNSVSAVARFIHLLTGTKFTTIQNSDIYKKYLQMPNYKKDGQLIADLKFIRPYFEDFGLDSAVKLIDEELKRTIKELPYGERKKYDK